jgi:pyruvate dehydrogenase E1 component alpha subunit
MNKSRNNSLELFKSMLRIRMVEESIAEKYSEGKMRCPTHLSIGQEAIATGVCSALEKKDLVLSTHRAHAHYLAKGGSLKSMIAEIYGKVTGCSMGMGGSMHLIDKRAGFMGSTAIVGNTIPVAVGLALSIKLKRRKNISCVFFGDGAVEEGVFYEAVNFAVVKKLPILFVCENNLYSVYSGLEVRQPENRKIYKMVRALGIDTHKGDGNDVEEVFSLTKLIREKIVNNAGPQFIELDTYRWREHCGPNYDNDLGYRTEEEFMSWKKRDPIETQRKRIKSNEYFNLAESFAHEIEEAHKFADKSKYPSYKQFRSIQS